MTAIVYVTWNDKRGHSNKQFRSYVMISESANYVTPVMGYSRIMITSMTIIAFKNQVEGFYALTNALKKCLVTMGL